MIEHELDKEHSILLLHPTSPLEPNDFAELAQAVDPFMEATGQLNSHLCEIS